MAIQGPFSLDFAQVFPFGCGVVSTVSPVNDFNRSTKENPVQDRDKVTGLPLWQVDVIDFDPEARDRTFKVKIVAEHQPVPPEAIGNTPLRPVFFENLAMTPWLDDRGSRPKVAYSLRCTGLAAPKAGRVVDGGKVEGRAA